MEKIGNDQVFKKFTEFIDEVTLILSEADKNGDFEKADEDLKRWKGRLVNYIKTNVNEIEGENLEKKRKSSFIMGAHLQNLRDEINMYRAFVMSLAEEIKNHPEEFIIEKEIKKITPAKEVSLELKTKTVFIIHGHDEINLLRLKEVLRERWHLDPLVLIDEAGTGRTLIEKFEQEAQRASFAIALFSPDDKIQDSKAPYSQARANVIFELGWFYGRLGREKVCILSKKGTTLHSDLNGIIRIDFQKSVEEITQKLEIELKKAGLIS